MRKSICVCKPERSVAGENSTWKFFYTPMSDLPKGTKLKFDMLNKGRPFDWQIPQTDLKKKANIIWAELPNKKILNAKAIDNTQDYTPYFEFELPILLKAGETIAIGLGTPDEDVEKKGTLSQLYVQRKRLFNLNVFLPGKKEPFESEVFHLDVRGNKLKVLRIITPSLVAKNKRFDVIVRFEDKFGNLTSNAPENTLIELSYENLRENLSWKLFIPETGFINLPNLYFNEVGVYKIQLKNLSTNEVFLSSPIKCLAEADLSVFFGLFHGESERFDAEENIDSCLRYFRDEKALNFYSTSSFDSEKETSNDSWKKIVQYITEFNEDDRFVTFLGQNWLGTPKEEGLRQFIFLKDAKPLLRKKDLKSNALKKIYKTFHPKELISIPSFTMGKDSCFNFQEFDAAFERVVEIYNAWGSSECSSQEGNLRPIKESKKSQECLEGSIQKALLNNCRFGFIAGGLDDRDVYSPFYDSNQTQYSPGLTAIYAKEQSRSSLVESLYNRNCYATTGSRIILGFFVANTCMGTELNTGSKPGLMFNRYISGHVVGTDFLKEVSIIRNSKVLTTFHPNSTSFDFDFDDSEAFEKIALKCKNKEKPPFIFYYLRVVQKDGHIAWSSPIWIDNVNNGQKLAKKLNLKLS
jgi:hypothetical protein